MKYDEDGFNTELSLEVFREQPQMAIHLIQFMLDRINKYRRGQYKDSFLVMKLSSLYTDFTGEFNFRDMNLRKMFHVNSKLNKNISNEIKCQQILAEDKPIIDEVCDYIVKAYTPIYEELVEKYGSTD